MYARVILILVVWLYYKTTPVSTHNSFICFPVHIILVVDIYSQVFKIIHRFQFHDPRITSTRIRLPSPAEFRNNSKVNIFDLRLRYVKTTTQFRAYLERPCMSFNGVFEVYDNLSTEK